MLRVTSVPRTVWFRPSVKPKLIELAFLPAEEAEAIALLGQEVLHTNIRAEFERDVAEADQTYIMGLIEAKAAQIVLQALAWRDRIAREIGWKPMWFDEDRERRLREIVRSKLSTYERLEDPGPTSS